MKRLVKTIVIIGALAAAVAVVLKVVLSRRSQPEDDIPLWSPPPRPADGASVPQTEPVVAAANAPLADAEPGAGPGAETPQPIVAEVPSGDEPVEFAAEVVEPDETPAADELPVEVDELSPAEDPLEFAAEVEAVEGTGFGAASDAGLESAPEITAAAEAERDDFLSRAFDQLAATEVGTPAVDAGIAPPEPEADLLAPAAQPDAESAPAAALEVPEGASEPAGADAIAPEAAAQHEAPSPPQPEALPESLEEALSGLDYVPITPPPARNAESYLDEGNVYFNVGQYALAIERYSRAAELDPNLISAYYNRANARTRAGEFELALADYDRALDLQPNDADALNNRGMLHLYRTNYSAALRDFNDALSADPTDTTVMVNRGLANLHGGNPQAALDDFRHATAADEHDAAAQYGAAQASAALGDREAALAAVESALRIDPAYAREAAGDPRLAILQGDAAFLKLLRESGTRSS